MLAKLNKEAYKKDEYAMVLNYKEKFVVFLVL